MRLLLLNIELSAIAFRFFLRVNWLRVCAKRHTKRWNRRMKYFSWNAEKNELLREERQVSFEDVVFYIEQGFLLDVLEHPNQEKYEAEEWQSARKLSEQKEQCRAYARATLRKDKRVISVFPRRTSLLFAKAGCAPGYSISNPDLKRIAQICQRRLYREMKKRFAVFTIRPIERLDGLYCLSSHYPFKKKSDRYLSDFSRTLDKTNNAPSRDFSNG